MHKVWSILPNPPWNLGKEQVRDRAAGLPNALLTQSPGPVPGDPFRHAKTACAPRNQVQPGAANEGKAQKSQDHQDPLGYSEMSGSQFSSSCLEIVSKPTYPGIGKNPWKYCDVQQRIVHGTTM